MTWQPIDTAPRDGRAILIAEEGDADGRCTRLWAAVVYWETAMNDWCGYYSGTHPLDVSPTLWAELPPLPERRT